jgi:hypothetical protein
MLEIDEINVVINIKRINDNRGRAFVFVSI